MWICPKCGESGVPGKHECPVVGNCPDCGVGWTLGREVGGRVHTPGGMDCLRRQNTALREALRDLSSGIDGIGQALHYGDISSAEQIVVVAQKHMEGMPRSWFFDAEVSDDAPTVTLTDVRSELMRVASALLTGPWASWCAEDWPSRPSGAAVARRLDQDRELRRRLALRLRDVLDTLGKRSDAS